MTSPVGACLVIGQGAELYVGLVMFLAPVRPT